ncbi:MAG: leucine-rich repeat protein [Prevotella sp.]|nr:leucine-rich repeat protein [Prevotella sp.]
MKKFVLLIGFITTAAFMKAANVVIDDISYNVDVETMEASVTYGNYDYRDVLIPESFEYNGKTFKVTSIGDKAFVNSKLISISIPYSVVSIGNNAFENNEFLDKLFIPNSVKDIGQYNEFNVKDSIIIEDGDQMLIMNENMAQTSRPVSRFYTKYLYIGRKLWGDGIFSDHLSYSVSLSSVEVLEYGDLVEDMLKIIWDGHTGTMHTLILGAGIKNMQSINGNKTINKIICRMQKPIGFDKDYVSTQQYLDTEIHIPYDTQSNYLKAEGWKYFLVYYEDVPTNINIVRKDRGALGIWTLDGKKINNSNFDKTNHPNGIYIIDGKKVIIRN